MFSVQDIANLVKILRSSSRLRHITRCCVMVVMIWLCEIGTQNQRREEKCVTPTQVAWFRAVEEARANRAREAETQRSNQARESEEVRHHFGKESMGWWTASETQRANMARESINRYEAEERARANRSQEYIRNRELDERIRANRAEEFNQSNRNIIKALDLRQTGALESRRIMNDSIRANAARHQVDELVRSNEARERQARDELKERSRSNRARERNDTMRTYGDWSKSLLGMFQMALK